MTKKIKRTMEYRRSEWQSNEGIFLNQDLEYYIREAWQKLPDATSRAINIAGNEYTLMGNLSLDLQENGFAFSCVKYVEGRGVGVLPMQQKSDIHIKTLNPRTKENFLDSHMVVLIKGKHLITIGAGKNASILTNYLKGLFEKARLDNNTANFLLSRIANIDAIKKIQRYGVISVDLDFELSAASYDSMRPNQNLLSSVIGAIIARDNTTEEIKKMANGRVGISIQQKGISKSLNTVARNIVEDCNRDEGESYSIKLKNGNKLSPHDISMQRVGSFDPIANFIDLESAAKLMSEYLNELKENGYLEI